MSERSRPVRRLPKLNFTAADSNNRCGGQRAWAREVRSFTDSELILCVRAQVAVDTAVTTYRKSAAAPLSFDVPRSS